MSRSLSHAPKRGSRMQIRWVQIEFDLVCGELARGRNRGNSPHRSVWVAEETGIG
jgi:hypothetical protein